VITYPYYQTPDKIYFPIIPVDLDYRQRMWSIKALVDSGATISIFKEEVAEELGLGIEKGEEIFLGGVGGRIKGFIHNLNLSIGGKRFKAPVVFSREFKVSINLIGRKKVFENFLVTFDEKNKKVKLET